MLWSTDIVEIEEDGFALGMNYLCRAVHRDEGGFYDRRMIEHEFIGPERCQPLVDIGLGAGGGLSVIRGSIRKKAQTIAVAPVLAEFAMSTAG
jgi:hypothetical protein